MRSRTKLPYPCRTSTAAVKQRAKLRPLNAQYAREIAQHKALDAHDTAALNAANAMTVPDCTDVVTKKTNADSSVATLPAQFSTKYKVSIDSTWVYDRTAHVFSHAG